jgi:transcriptional repressor NrdR
VRLGIERACWKRHITAEQITSIVTEIENTIDSQSNKEVDSRMIGEMVMNRLRDLDQVAYVRFASVYREFQDGNDFARELQKMLTPQVVTCTPDQ